MRLLGKTGPNGGTVDGTAPPPFRAPGRAIRWGGRGHRARGGTAVRLEKPPPLSVRGAWPLLGPAHPEAVWPPNGVRWRNFGPFCNRQVVSRPTGRRRARNASTALPPARECGKDGRQPAPPVDTVAGRTATVAGLAEAPSNDCISSSHSLMTASDTRCSSNLRGVCAVAPPPHKCRRCRCGHAVFLSDGQGAPPSGRLGVNVVGMGVEGGGGLWRADAPGGGRPDPASCCGW